MWTFKSQFFTRLHWEIRKNHSRKFSIYMQEAFVWFLPKEAGKIIIKHTKSYEEKPYIITYQKSSVTEWKKTPR